MTIRAVPSVFLFSIIRPRDEIQCRPRDFARAHRHRRSHPSGVASRALFGVPVGAHGRPSIAWRRDRRSPVGPDIHFVRGLCLPAPAVTRVRSTSLRPGRVPTCSSCGRAAAPAHPLSRIDCRRLSRLAHRTQCPGEDSPHIVIEKSRMLIDNGDARVRHQIDLLLRQCEAFQFIPRCSARSSRCRRRTVKSTVNAAPLRTLKRNTSFGWHARRRRSRG